MPMLRSCSTGPCSLTSWRATRQPKRFGRRLAPTSLPSPRVTLMSNVQWDGEMDDWHSDGYEAEKEAARSEKRTVVLDLEYNPEEAEDVEQWLNADRITDSIWGDDH